MRSSPEILLWVTEWGVWPSGECQPLAKAVRAGFGSTQLLADQRGHLVRESESDEGLAVLALSALLMWDCWVVRVSGCPVFAFSHDEYVAVFSRREDEVDSIVKKLELFSVQASSPAA